MSAIDKQLCERAMMIPRQPALVTYAADQMTVWTWQELERVTAPIAASLTEAGVRGGRRVLLAATGNGPEEVLTLIGMLRTELPVALLARTAPEGEVSALKETLLHDGYDVVQLLDGRSELSCSTAPEPAALPAESVLMPTGGSSGRPRIVIETRIRTITQRPRATRPTSVMNWRPDQRQMIIGPLYHAGPLTFFVEGLADGNTLIVPRSFNPAAALTAIGEWHVEWLQLTPYHMRHLAVTVARGHYDLSSVQGILHLAAHCPHQLKRTWIDLLGADRVFEMYGATERIGITIARGHEWLQHPGTVGRGFFTRIRITSEDGEALPAGVCGHVYLQSGPATRRYMSSSDGVSMTVDGYASVGDRGWLDEDGYLYLAHRQLARIQIGGETVDPAEVESVLMEHPSVVDAGIVGIHDKRLGEALVAVVVPTGLPNPHDLRRYLRERVARHKVPRQFLFVENVPHSDVGKIDRQRLYELTTQHDQGIR